MAMNKKKRGVGLAFSVHALKVREASLNFLSFATGMALAFEV